METSAQRCARIVRALEDLAAQEAAAVHTGDFSAATRVQERAAPLVDFLAGDRGALDVALTNRIRAVHRLRARTGERLAGEMERTREALREMQAARSRVGQIAPVYGSQRSGAGSWRAIG